MSAYVSGRFPAAHMNLAIGERQTDRERKRDRERDNYKKIKQLI